MEVSFQLSALFVPYFFHYFASRPIPYWVSAYSIKGTVLIYWTDHPVIFFYCVCTLKNFAKILKNNQKNLYSWFLHLFFHPRFRALTQPAYTNLFLYNVPLRPPLYHFTMFLAYSSQNSALPSFYCNIFLCRLFSAHYSSRNGC